jgi:hypothetical protein
MRKSQIGIAILPYKCYKLKLITGNVFLIEMVGKSIKKRGKNNRTE